jgi:DNA (cytosine-5)-methyltransferase 1
MNALGYVLTDHSSVEDKYTFIDPFAGIGDTRIGFGRAGCRCVCSSEWDKFWQITYKANFREISHEDINEISSDEIPANDILVAGFPC